MYVATFGLSTYLFSGDDDHVSIQGYHDQQREENVEKRGLHDIIIIVEQFIPAFTSVVV